MQNFKNLDNKQKSALALILLALIALGVYVLTSKSGPALTLEQRCAIDLESTVLEDVEGKLKTDEEITEALFNHYFSYYKDKAQCPQQNLSDYKLNNVEVVKTSDMCLIVDIDFDLKPTSMTETLWKTEESVIDNDWIRGKKGNIDITKSVATSSSDISRYQLNLQSPCQF